MFRNSDSVYCALLLPAPCDHEYPTLSTTTHSPLRILGIDPGLRVTGFGVIEKHGNRLTYVASGCIRTDATTSLPARLGTINTGINELLQKYQPDQAVIEIVFVNVNPHSTLLLGQARAHQRALAVREGMLNIASCASEALTSSIQVLISSSTCGLPARSV